jgi:two-component system probable response regulator PhcQ
MLVDDEPNVLSALRRVLSGIGTSGARLELEIETYTEPAEALERACCQPYDLVISDYRMPAMSGVEFLQRFIELQPNVARLIVSGYADLPGLIDAINRVQIFRFIAKPWHDFELRAAVGQALQYREMIRENQRLADVVRVQQGRLSRQKMELARLEEQYPGITHVERDADGGILIAEGEF